MVAQRKPQGHSEHGHGRRRQGYGPLTAMLLLILSLLGGLLLFPPVPFREGTIRPPMVQALEPLGTLPVLPELPGEEVALGHKDLTRLDLSGSGTLLRNHASFDTFTLWPSSLPEGFAPGRFMALGKDPGLRLQELHRQGIDGRGVRVAVIDQPLLLSHEAYKGKVARYVEVGQTLPMTATMHPVAIASLLVGGEIGVAPGAQYEHWAVQQKATFNRWTYRYYAAALERILDENKKLPREQQVRVVSLSQGYDERLMDWPRFERALKRARDEGVFVVQPDLAAFYPFTFTGLGREPDADPNRFESYRPARMDETWFYKGTGPAIPALYFPMDSRTVAAPAGEFHYRFDRLGGYSWVMPYAAGVYALALQVKPDLTPEEFVRVGRETGRYITFTNLGMEYRLGPIVDPAALVARLQP